MTALVQNMLEILNYIQIWLRLMTILIKNYPLNIIQQQFYFQFIIFYLCHKKVVKNEFLLFVFNFEIILLKVRLALGNDYQLYTMSSYLISDRTKFNATIDNNIMKAQRNMDTLTKSVRINSNNTWSLSWHTRKPLSFKNK